MPNLPFWLAPSLRPKQRPHWKRGLAICDHKRCGRELVRRAKPFNIARERLGKQCSLARQDGAFIGLEPAKEISRQLSHSLGHGKVANPSLAKTRIEVSEETVGEFLSQRRGASVAPDTNKRQRGEQRQKFKAPL